MREKGGGVAQAVRVAGTNLDDRGHSDRITCCFGLPSGLCVLVLEQKKKLFCFYRTANPLPLHLPCVFTPD